MADMAVQLLLSGTEAQLQLGEFRVSSGKTQLEAGKPSSRPRRRNTSPPARRR